MEASIALPALAELHMPEERLLVVHAYNYRHRSDLWECSSMNEDCHRMCSPSCNLNQILRATLEACWDHVWLVLL